jgi:hypothetical protein
MQRNKKQFNKEVISMMRGSILNNGTDFYALVRAELGNVKDANGSPIIKQARYNLVNLGTGKTRVSEPERMFLQDATVDEVDIRALRNHFNLPNLTDTGVKMQDINIPNAVREAVAAKERARVEAMLAQASGNNILNLLAAQLNAATVRGVCLW